MRELTRMLAAITAGCLASIFIYGYLVGIISGALCWGAGITIAVCFSSYLASEY